MNKIETMKRKLSSGSLAVLAGLGGETPGYVVTAPTYPVSAAVLAELRDAGVIGPNDGLTVIGSGLVAKLRAELLDSLF